MNGDPRSAPDPLDLVERHNPARPAALASRGIEDALDALGGAIIASDRAPRTTGRRSFGSRRRLLVVAAGVAAIAAGGATGAIVVGAHTGIFPSKADQAVGGPGEALNPAASDFRAVALKISSDIRYPRGYDSWREWVIEEQAPTAETGPGGAQFPAGLVSSGALHGWFAASAFCAWVQSWRQATATGDPGAAAQAAQTIKEAPNWRAVRDEDPHPDPASANDQGATTGTLFGWMVPYRDAVLAGDRARVEHLLATGYGDGKCWLSDPEWMAELRAHRRDWGRLSPSEMTRKYEHFLARVRP